MASIEIETGVIVIGVLSLSAFLFAKLTEWGAPDWRTWELLASRSRRHLSFGMLHGCFSYWP
jgi:hypothetical protein